MARQWFGQICILFYPGIVASLLAPSFSFSHGHNILASGLYKGRRAIGNLGETKALWSIFGKKSSSLVIVVELSIIWIVERFFLLISRLESKQRSDSTAVLAWDLGGRK